MCKLNMDINFQLNEELDQLAACNVLLISVKLNLSNSPMYNRSNTKQQK